MQDLEWSAEVEQAEWIRARLGPFSSGALTSVVPAGFEAYARVLHPAHDAEAHPIRWSQVAAHNGIEMRRDAHFPEIALLPPGEVAWEVVGPEEGTLSAADAAALVDMLREHTASPDHCWFCLWDGYGTTATERGSMRDRPRVTLPGRDYLLHHARLDADLPFVESEQQTPNLWWPADRAWCLASELDLGWTYVGGSAELIDQLVRDDRIEALHAKPTDSHHHRLPAWLSPVLDTAVSQVLAGHPGRVQTQLGTVTATMRAPQRWRRGELWITTTRPDGSTGGESWGSLPKRDENALRQDVRNQLTWELISLLG